MTQGAVRPTDRKRKTLIMTVRQSVNIQIHYNAIRFFNDGATPVNIENMTLQPGQSRGWAYNENEVDDGNIYVSFPDGTNAGLCHVIASYYID